MIKRLLSKLRSIQIVRYSFVGGVAALVDLTIFFLFAKLLDFNYLLIGAAGFIIATYVNYILSIKYVFESKIRFTRKAEVFWIYLISLVGLFLHLIFLYVFIDLLYMEKMLGKVMASFAVFLWNFLMRKHFIFK